MYTKLTLRLEAGLIRRAKVLAKQRGKSVSRLVADYLTLLEPPSAEEPSASWSLLVRALKGSLRDARVDEKDYRRYLARKHR